MRRGSGSSTDSAIIGGGRTGRYGLQTSEPLITHPRSSMDFITASTKLACDDRMRSANTAPGKRSTLNGRARDGSRQESTRESLTLTPSRRYDISSSRKGCLSRITSSQNAKCFRTKRGTNAFPPPPLSHTAACYGNRRSTPCIRSRTTSAQTGNAAGGWNFASVSTHPRSSADRCDIERKNQSNASLATI